MRINEDYLDNIESSDEIIQTDSSHDKDTWPEDIFVFGTLKNDQHSMDKTFKLISKFYQTDDVALYTRKTGFGEINPECIPGDCSAFVTFKANFKRYNDVSRFIKFILLSMSNTAEEFFFEHIKDNDIDNIFLFDIEMLMFLDGHPTINDGLKKKYLESHASRICEFFHDIFESCSMLLPEFDRSLLIKNLDEEYLINDTIAFCRINNLFTLVGLLPIETRNLSITLETAELLLGYQMNYNCQSCKLFRGIRLLTSEGLRSPSKYADYSEVVEKGVIVTNCTIYANKKLNTIDLQFIVGCSEKFPVILFLHVNTPGSLPVNQFISALKDAFPDVPDSDLLEIKQELDNYKKEK